MTASPPRFWKIFLELFVSLPRQGPGNRSCATQALGLCRDLPPSPAVLDLGCSVGGQTLHLAELLPGATITAIDSHALSIEQLHATVAKRGLAERGRPVVGELARSGLPSQSCDLVWSERAIGSPGSQRATAPTCPAKPNPDRGWSVKP